MLFLKRLFKIRKIVFELGKSDFKNRFAGTALGLIWGFITPFMFMLMYVIVFQFILKTKSSEDFPYITWLLPGISIWMFINDSIINCTNSIRTYSYLVKKVVFPVDVIPTISLVSTSIIGLFMIIITIIVCLFYGLYPNVFLLLYYLFATLVFIISLTRLTSAIATLIPDFANVIGVLMQFVFWLTPIMWNMNMINGVALKIIKCSPFAYLVNGFRQVFGTASIKINGIYTLVFWVITILIFFWGNYVFNKSKKEFADVL